MYVSDGSGSGAWSRNFNPYFFHAQDQKSSGTAGGTFTAGSWVTRTLNTAVTSDISSASLNTSTSRLTLPAGTYYVEASAPGYAIGFHKIKLRSITGSSDLLIGTSEVSNGETTRSFLSGVITLAGSTVVELQHRCSVTGTTTGLGNPNSFSVVEVYADLRVWKIK